jgi:hypothetical protein
VSLWASFHASACSRPPEPTTNTFIPASLVGRSVAISAFLVREKRVRQGRRKPEY